jgi:two-component system nitrate/nitrite response regulator NarL
MYEDERDRTPPAPSHLSDSPLQPSVPVVGAPVVKSIALVVAARLFRDCLEHVLRKVARFEIQACETLAEIGQVGAAAPDLMIYHVDASDNIVDVFHRIRRVQNRNPSVRCLFLCRDANIDFVRDAIEHGVQGILLEESPEDVLRMAVDTILLGYSFVPVALSQLMRPHAGHSAALAQQKTWINPKLRENASPDPDNKPVERVSFPLRHWHLSSRETQILCCLEQGHSNKVIARELDIAEATVKVHVQALLRKMQVTNRTQAAMAARNFLGSVGGPGQTNILPRPSAILSTASSQAIHENMARPAHNGQIHAGDLS